MADMNVALALWVEFPKLAPPAKFEITSDKDSSYNCIGFAAEEHNPRWWWPDKMKDHYWPPDAPEEVTLPAFIAAFETIGYQLCDNPDLEAGYEKIALYSKPAGTPTHAAKQQPDGLWKSKLGKFHDIKHELQGLESKTYGKVARFMKRPSADHQLENT
jgi:hypothetical protein